MYTPQETNKTFPENPFTGFAAWGKSLYYDVYFQPCSMLYARLYWAQVETEKGKFKWDQFEADWNFNAVTGSKKIILRVVLDNPSEHLPGQDREIPDWLYSDIGEQGTWYDDPFIGNGFSPNYESPVLINNHKRFIKELGKRYNNDPRIAFIQIGSIGHWAEWHTWPEKTGAFPDYNVAAKYVQHYINAFPGKMLVVRRPVQIHAAYPAIGLYNDVIGHAETATWLSWIKNGYTSEWDKGEHPALISNWWQNACSGGELATHAEGVEYWLSDEQFPETIRQLQDSHTSWIGPNSPGQIEHSLLYQQKIDTILNTLGYRFIFKNIFYQKVFERGGPFIISFTVGNKGTAPFYYRWPFEVAFIDSTGGISHSVEPVECNIVTWLPGEHPVSLKINIPRGIVSGEYDITFAIKDPATNMPEVDFAIDQNLRRFDKRYVIGHLKIK